MSDEIRLIGADAAARDFRRLVVGISDLRPFWPRVVRLVRGWTKAQFESEGAFWGIGNKWAPLSPDYAARKRTLWGDRPILVASGQAKRAADNPERIPRPLSLTLVIDDSGPEHDAVLAFHQEGGDPPGSAPYPARPVFGEELPPLAVFELEREAEGYIRDLLGRH